MNILSYIIDNPNYILEKTLEHFYIFLFSWSIAVIVGISIGIFVTRPERKKAGRLILAITGATQSVPSIAVIALVFMFVGIGPTPALIALFLYSLVPIVFNTASGLINVSEKMKESARGMGMTSGQILRRVEIPVSIPAILSGIRSAATINIGAAAIAAAIGAGGLGEIIFMGLRMIDASMIFGGALPVALLAIIVDLLLELAENKFTSKGLQLSR